MPCDRVKLPGGGTAIVCSGRQRRYCKCGRRGTLLCDAKVETRWPSGTCDKPICDRCAVDVGADRHLCPAHVQAEYSPPAQGELL